jgi:hypothetical protein
MNLTKNQITFLRDVPTDINVNTSSGWRHHYFNGSIEELSTFIKLIDDNKIYLLIPLFAASPSLRLATLNLSEPFLVNNQSNSALIINFIGKQWISSGFTLTEGTLLTFSFKFKRVWFSYK